MCITIQVDCDNLITPELPVRKISHDLPYQVTLGLFKKNYFGISIFHLRSHEMLQACSEEDARRDFSKRNTVYKK